MFPDKRQRTGSIFQRPQENAVDSQQMEKTDSPLPEEIGSAEEVILCRITQLRNNRWDLLAQFVAMSERLSCHFQQLLYRKLEMEDAFDFSEINSFMEIKSQRIELFRTLANIQSESQRLYATICAQVLPFSPAPIDTSSSS